MQVYLDAENAKLIGIAPALAHLDPDQPVHNNFSSIPATLWFMIVTLMTVGFGDMIPTTIVGQLVTCLAMVLSMLVLALPISVVGTNFTQVREASRPECAQSACCVVPRAGVLCQRQTCGTAGDLFGSAL